MDDDIESLIDDLDGDDLDDLDDLVLVSTGEPAPTHPSIIAEPVEDEPEPEPAAPDPYAKIIIPYGDPRLSDSKWQATHQSELAASAAARIELGKFD